MRAQKNRIWMSIQCYFPYLSSPHFCLFQDSLRVLKGPCLFLLQSLTSALEKINFWYCSKLSLSKTFLSSEGLSCKIIEWHHGLSSMAAKKGKRICLCDIRQKTSLLGHIKNGVLIWNAKLHLTLTHFEWKTFGLSSSSSDSVRTFKSIFLTYTLKSTF